MSQSDNRKIAIVAIPNAQKLIEEISEEYYLWIVNTPENRLALKSITGELTTFPYDSESSICDEIDNYLFTVIEHHHDWEEILLVGVKSKKAVEALLSEIEPHSLSINDHGLQILRSKIDAVDV